MECFKCHKNFDSLQHLLLHLKFGHDFLDNDVYKCTAENCGKQYTSLNSFKKHCRHLHPCELSRDNVIYIPERVHEPINVQLVQNVCDFDNDTSETSRNNQIDHTEKANLELYSANFVSALYNNAAVSRNVVQVVVDLTSKFFENYYIPLLKNQILYRLQNVDISNVHHVVDEIDTVLDNNSRPFEKLKTEYKRFYYFKKNRSFIPPHQYVIGQTIVQSTRNGVVVSEPINVTGQWISLRETLKLILHIPGFLLHIKKYVKLLLNETNTVSNFIQGELWRNKLKTHGSKYVLPLFIFFDDYDTGNVLGSHSGSNKLGVTYVTIPCIPPQYASKLNHIYLTLLFYSKHRVEFGNRAVFQILIDELNDLQENGIAFQSEIIYFECGLIIGDNLGIHSIFGLVESFRANYCCRFCNVPRAVSKMLCVEDKTLLRTKENYMTDVELNNVSVTGIKEVCVWHDLKSFHLTENLSVDIMHDILEGVCNYTLLVVLNNLIFEKKYFSLDILNSRICTFNYGHLEQSNAPPQISTENLKSKIKMSASEMACFTRYLGLMVGDVIPRNIKCWKLYLKLRSIIDIITAPTLSFNHAVLLDTLISEHHMLYIEMCGETLKPKYHHMIHYARIFKLVGPLVHCWAMRFESKHRQSKLTASISGCKKNILYTLAVKHQLKLCHFLNTHNELQYRILGPACDISCNTFKRSTFHLMYLHQ